MRVARSKRLGRDAKRQTLVNKSTHQQPGNHPHKKQEIKHSIKDTSEASSHIGGNGQLSFNSSQTHNSITTHIIRNIYAEHTHNGNHGSHDDRYIDQHHILNAYNHARRADARCADDMRRICQQVKMPAGGEYNAANKPAGLECTGVRFRYEFSPLDSGGRRT